MTPTAQDVINEMKARITMLRRVDLDEANTFTRLAIRTRIEVWEEALSIVTSRLPRVEEEARDAIDVAA